MIVWLASYPRSGNAFALLLLKSHYCVEARTVYPPPQVEERLPFRQFMVGTLDPFDIAQAETCPEPVVVKTHEMPSGDEHPAIYIVRDGRDALVSYARLVLSRGESGVDVAGFDTYEGLLREMIVNEGYFGGWSRHALEWSRRGGRLAVVRYEDLVVRPFPVIEEALDKIDVRLSPKDGSMPSFDELHQRFPWYFRKGKVGSWREEMPPDLQDLFWERHGSVMERFGYGRAAATGT